jgi:hypothetical protein
LRWPGAGGLIHGGCPSTRAGNPDCSPRPLKREAARDDEGCLLMLKEQQQ